MRDAWRPEQHDRFATERRQPLHDLLAGIDAPHGGSVVDLGCGTGETTAIVHERLGAARTIGIDNSPAMLSRSSAHVRADIAFEIADIGTWAPGRTFDVVFSNAALHWLDDHPALFRRILGLVRPGGRLAVQMPANHDHQASRVAAEVAQEEPFRAALGGYARQSPVLTPVDYQRLLFALGAKERRVRLEVYGHELATRDAVVEWVRGTTLTAYESRLPAELWPAFLARYRAVLFERLPDERPFLFPFPRVFLWATAPTDPGRA